MNVKRLVLLSVLALSLVPLAGRAFADTNADLEKARAATERFVTRVGAGEAAGYGLFRDAAGLACIAQPGLGAMGVHYVNGALVGDTVLDPAAPGGARLRAERPRPAEARRPGVHRVQGRLGRDKRVAADAVRSTVRPHAGAEPVRHPRVLLAARLDLEGQSSRHLQALEPARDLRLRGDKGRVRGDRPSDTPSAPGEIRRAQRQRDRAEAEAGLVEALEALDVEDMHRERRCEHDEAVVGRPREASPSRRCAGRLTRLPSERRITSGVSVT